MSASVSISPSKDGLSASTRRASSLTPAGWQWAISSSKTSSGEPLLLCLLHAVSGSDPQYPRRMHRTTIKGDYGLGHFENGGVGDALLEMTV